MALPVKDFIVQKLLEFDPRYDTGAGVPTTGMLIEPLSVILQPVIDELTLVEASQSILTILEADDPDSFPEDIVDGLASNVLIERNPGQIASDVVRVRFFEPQIFAAQQGVLVFRGPSAQRYTNSEAISITSAEMSLNQEGNLFFLDIPIVALEEGSSFNVAAGEITAMEAEPIGVANLTNLFGSSEGRNRETNTELVARMKVAVTVRALVTGRGIIVTLTENFTTIEEIQPIGFGDPEMMRDIVYNVHIGGNVDVYVKTPNFVATSKDISALEVDTSRQNQASSTVVALEQDIGYSLGRSPIDRTNGAPTAHSIDSLVSFEEGDDYTIDDAQGLFFRIAGSDIFHLEGSAAAVTDLKTLTLNAAFGQVRPGMILTIDAPASVAGTYTIKEVPNDDSIVVFGSFAVASETGVSFQIDENVVVSFEYNPVTVDIIKTPRSDDRAIFTITDVPLMQITSIEELDPVSGEPTGTVLGNIGGFGAGGFGAGGFGSGSGADYRIVVAEPTLRFSEREDDYIEFKSQFVGASVRVNYEYASAIPPIQAFMEDRNNQSQSASLLARHFIPVFVDATQTIVYRIPAATQTTAPTVEGMQELVSEFINDIDQGEGLELSDVVDLLYDNGASRVDIGTLNGLRGEIHHLNGSVEFALPDEAGVISIPEEEIPDPSDKPLSPRNARFIARNITLQRLVA
jgi:Baseplate J-like protein